MKLEKFSNLSARLREIETDNVETDDGCVQEARVAVVDALTHYGGSRVRLGKTLAAYKVYFTAERGWMEAAKTIAKAASCDERTHHHRL